MRKRAAGYLAALLPLWGFSLVRLWAVLAGVLPGKVIALLALGISGALLLLLWRGELDRRLFAPFRPYYVNLIVAAPAALVGGLLDVSPTMVQTQGTLLDALPFRLLCALGSGLILACLTLAVCAAAKVWGRPDGSGAQMLLLAVLVNAVTAFYVFTSATVYVWDNAGYWTVARDLAAQPLSLAQLREVAATTVTLDYNHLLAWPISLVMRLLGGSRGVFLFSIANLYLLPGLYGLCQLGRGGKWGGLLLAALLPGLTYLALVGYVDVAPCAVGIWAVVFYTRREAPAWSRGVLAGTCLVLTFLLRRYFLFFAAAFALAALLRALFQRTQGEWTALGAVFAAAAGWAVYATQAFLVDKLTTNYGDLYTAYDLGLSSDVMLFCRYFGFLVLAAALLWGLFRAIVQPSFRPDAILALGTLVLCFLLLTRVQSHGQQHTLLYLPCLALLLAPAEEDPRWRRYGAWALAAVCALTPILPRSQPASIAQIRFPDPVPGFTYHGPRRQDIHQLLALSDCLDALAAQDPGLTVAVCASSFLLNSETLTNLRPSLGLPQRSPAPQYLYVHDVDKRDSFSWNMLEADYLIVGDPVQVHLGEENQQLIALVAHPVLEGTGLGTAYTRLEQDFTLQDGSAVYLYRRTREVTAGEREAISRALVERYPDYAGLYALPSG